MSPKQVLVILWRRLWIIVLTFVSTLAGAAAIILFVPAKYDAIATASIDPGQADPITGQLVGAVTTTALLQGNLVALVKSDRVARDVVKRLNLASNPDTLDDFRQSEAFGRVDISEWVATEILKNFDAKFGLQTNVLTITYRSTSPIQGALIANAFMSSFIDEAVDMKVSSAQQTAQWFNPQMDKLRTELAAARDKLAEFQRDTKLLAPSLNGDSENSQLMSVTNDLSSARATLSALESRLNAQSDEGAAEPGESSDPDAQLLIALKAKLASVATDIGRLQVEVGANNPKLSALRATLKSLQDQIRTETANFRDKLVDRIRVLKQQIASLESARTVALQRMIDIQAQRDRLASLVREVDFRQEQLDGASKAAAQARMQSQLSFSNISVIDAASPPISPAFPKFILVVIGGVGAGLALGIVFALLGEAFDRRIRESSDLEFAANAPVLGTLAWAASRRWRIVRWKGALVPQSGRSMV
jgi:uncharacterized protein involved in exopolysaccharide biosynthesis